MASPHPLASCHRSSMTTQSLSETKASSSSTNPRRLRRCFHGHKIVISPSFFIIYILALLVGGDVLCLLAFSSLIYIAMVYLLFFVETLKAIDPFIAGLHAFFLFGYVSK
ncbi:hypothetical protein IEQ34_006281 [Dendrobium chrysotoxum]|uniref:Uncharacterized protein n=1 Tax=Dendrobium chrysotoxum TaxID=161865 RepID=A0AAV7HEZ8_DENCH|nr:hypothetical protein IEQ34_006281 [Dendrobium chrysotoxum]